MTTTLGRNSCPIITDAGLPVIDYQQAGHPDEAHDIIRRARKRAPIAIGPHGPELLTYDLVHAVLRDARFRVPQGMFLAAQGITSGPVWDRMAASLISMDGADHHRLRRLVAKAFTPRAVARLHTTIDEVIAELVDQHVTAGHCDVVADIARQFPIPIICALLGAPPQDWELFSDWADDIFGVFSWDAAAQSPTILAAWQSLDSYIDDMVARRRRELTDDLLSELIRAEQDGDRLTTDELRMLAAALLIAGTDTTRHQLAASVHMLCDHPGQWALLGSHPELAAAAVEETIRYAPVAFGALRVALVDVELSGVLIPAGTLVLANTAAANRDPAIFDDPDRLDITRASAAPILTFGGGMHYCLGANLARLELAGALRVITRRMPGARRTGPAPWRPLTELSGPVRLPVEFDSPTVRSKS